MITMQPVANQQEPLTIAQFITPLLERRDLGREQAAQLVHAMLAPHSADAQIAAALALLAGKGECAAELAGFADALYERVLPAGIPADVLDTAGTGASPVKSFNVSSAAAFVIAAAGCGIAKHGARAATSRSGSADVLTSLGVRIDCDPALAARCLRELGICFLFAPQYHPALARVAPVRRALGFRTAFNLVGPMVNPARAQYRLLGVASRERMEAVAGALALLGVERAWILRGGDGLDEITSAGPSHVLEVRSGGGITALTVTPEDFGLRTLPTAAARAHSIEENAAMVRAVLSGSRRDVARELVLLNAAAALHVRTGESLRDSAARAARAVDEGAALARLESLIALSNSAHTSQEAAQ
jgi:anthranilate phosphoribosyltransferase